MTGEDPDGEEGGDESIEDLFGKGEPEGGDDGGPVGAKIDETWKGDGETGGEDEEEIPAEDGASEAGESETEAEAEVEAETEGDEGEEGEEAGDGAEEVDGDPDVEADGDEENEQAALGDEDEPEDDGDATDRDEAESTGDEDTATDGDGAEEEGGSEGGSLDDTVPTIDSGAFTRGGGALAVDDTREPPEFGGGGAGGDGGRLSTGIEALDHHLGGGIPPGRIVSFVATADTQSELLVKQLASQHDCLYLSTLRPKWEVQEDVTDYIQKRGEVTKDRSVQIEQLTADSRLDAARRHVEELERRSIVVVDSANELESSEKDRYAYFIDEVKRALWDTGSVGLFYCIEEEEPPAGRAVTLRRADVIWRLRQSENVGGIRHELLISKFRGGRALIEPLTLWLTDEVVMDDGSGAG